MAKSAGVRMGNRERCGHPFSKIISTLLTMPRSIRGICVSGLFTMREQGERSLTYRGPRLAVIGSGSNGVVVGGLLWSLTCWTSPMFAAC